MKSKTWLSRITSLKPSRSARRLAFESLEDRRILSATSPVGMVLHAPIAAPPAPVSPSQQATDVATANGTIVKTAQLTDTTPYGWQYWTYNGDPTTYLEDGFGRAVAISGTTSVVGVPHVGTCGAVELFPATGTGTAGPVTLVPSDPGDTNDEFGYSVAMSGDTIVVGAPATAGNSTRLGAVYVFVKPATGWPATMHETAKLTASDEVDQDGFGAFLSVSGDTVVVGSMYATVGRNAEQGKAYVFTKPSGGWSDMTKETAQLVAPDGAAYDQFGDVVAIDGDTVVLGAQQAAVQQNGQRNAQQGKAYVFVKPGNGWSGTIPEPAELTASDGQAGDYLGWWAGVSGNTVVVSAPLAKVGENAQQGAAYVFEKPDSGWSGHLNESAKLTASAGNKGDQFGSGVAIDGAKIVAGAPLAAVGTSTQTNIQQGAAYVFEKPSAGWPKTMTETTKRTDPAGQSGEQLGSFVAIGGNTMLLGATQPLFVYHPGSSQSWKGGIDGGGDGYTARLGEVIVEQFKDKATPSINWSTPASMLVNVPLGSAQLNATATAIVGGSSVSVAGTFSYNPPLGTVFSHPTNTTLSVTFTPSDATAYNSVSADVPLQVRYGADGKLSASARTITSGKFVTLTVTLTAAKKGTGKPTGTVIFYDTVGGHQQELGRSTLNGKATATFKTKTLLAGTNAITAVYQGDGNFIPRTKWNSVTVRVKSKKGTALSSAVDLAWLSAVEAALVGEKPAKPNAHDAALSAMLGEQPTVDSRSWSLD